MSDKKGSNRWPWLVAILLVLLAIGILIYYVGGKQPGGQTAGQPQTGQTGQAGTQSGQPSGAAKTQPPPQDTDARKTGAVNKPGVPQPLPQGSVVKIDPASEGAGEKPGAGAGTGKTGSGADTGAAGAGLETGQPGAGATTGAQTGQTGSAAATGTQAGQAGAGQPAAQKSSSQPGQLMQARKKPFGIKESLDAVVRTDESIDVAGVVIPVAELERKIVVEQRGEVLEKPLDRPAQVSAWGIYLVRKGDNLWDIHFQAFGRLPE
jgi:hypothetical protein